MLNMTVEQFEEKLDELLIFQKELKNKQSVIMCHTVEDNVMCFDTETLLMFADRKKISVVAERYSETTPVCRYKYSFYYKKVELIGFSSEEEYQLYKEGGLIS